MNCLQGIGHTDGSEACLEPSAFFLAVQGDFDLLVVRLDEKPREET